MKRLHPKNFDAEGFTKWLYSNYSKNKRVISNTVSRAKRIETVLNNFDPPTSFYEEVKKDNGEHLLTIFAVYGSGFPESSGLPVGKPQINVITLAGRKYINFLNDKFKKEAKSK